MLQVKKARACAMCGGEASTVDHIPPQSLYPRPRRPNFQLHTVPACATCNNGASSDDEEFKMIIGLSTGEGQADPDLIAASMRRTMDANNRLDRVVRAGKHTFAADGGRVIEGPVVIPFEGPSYAKVVERIIRGLYWRETQQPLGRDVDVQVLDASRLSPEGEALFRDLLPDHVPRFLNDGTFCYKVGFSSDGSSLWGLQFFGRHTVFGAASQPSHKPDAES